MSSGDIENPAVDKRDVITHVAFKGVQTGALLAPPIILGLQLYRRQFSVKKWLFRSSLYAYAVGAPLGAAVGYARIRNMQDVEVFDRAYRLRHSTSQVRVDDYSMIGGVLGALLTTTVLLHRASPITLLMGGSTLGISGGVYIHIFKTVKDSRAPMKEIADAVPLKETAKEIKEGKGDRVIKGE